VQAPQKHQKYVSHVLGLPMSKVVCKTKRIGGGFGGKETKSAFIAAAASVPSYLLNRPVKLTLDRDIDMMITGQRHSFLGKYKVSYSLLYFDYAVELVYLVQQLVLFLHVGERCWSMENNFQFRIFPTNFSSFFIFYFIFIFIES
jgi:hypothetical protein